MSSRRCLCKCHEGGLGDRQRADGVDVRDPAAAVTACSVCATHHVFVTVTDNGECNRIVPRNYGPDGEDGG